VILLTAAVADELAFWQPREGVETLITGIGPVEAACAIASALARHRYRLVVSAGIAGAFDGAATVGDGVVVGDETLELDLENGTPLALPPGSALVDRAASDRALVDALRGLGFPALHGITVARCTASETTARRLRERGAQVESMEGFAVLRAAERARVPAIELRGISNRCGDPESRLWDFAAGVAGLQRILGPLFELPGVIAEPIA
jgi:futalosine hydrolase